MKKFKFSYVLATLFTFVLFSVPAQSQSNKIPTNAQNEKNIQLSLVHPKRGTIRPDKVYPRSLVGTHWRLERYIQGKRIYRPNSKEQYTLSFADKKNVFARISCNAGRGTWTSDGPNKIRISPIMTTRKFCIGATQLENLFPRTLFSIRFYDLKNGRLFLKGGRNTGTLVLRPM